MQKQSRVFFQISGAGHEAIGLALARLPEQIRGFGHVKERHLAAARPQWDTLMARWRGQPAEGRLAA